MYVNFISSFHGRFPEWWSHSEVSSQDGVVKCWQGLVEQEVTILQGVPCEYLQFLLHVPVNFGLRDKA